MAKYGVINGEGTKSLLDINSGELKGFNFVKVEKAALKEIHNLSQKSPKAVELLLFFMNKMKKQNVIESTRTKLIDEARMSESSFRRSMKLLEEKKFIKVIKSKGVTRWYLHPSVKWEGDEGSRLGFYNNFNDL